MRTPRQRGGAAVIVFLLLGGAAEAAAQLPSPARDAAVDLLEVVRSGDRSRIRTFLESRFTAEFVAAHPVDEYHVPVLASLGRQVYGLEAEGVELGGPTEATMLLAGPGRELELRLAVEAEPPHRIQQLGWGTPGPVIRAASLTDLDLELRRLADDARFSGVVLVADGGAIRFHEAYGWAERAGGVGNQRTTRFDIGSLSKLFTTTAVLRLAQDGRLDLGDPIGKYLGGFPADVAERVTILQLLKHRSGFGDYLTHPEFEAAPQRFRTPADYLPLARGQQPGFEPGAARRYSNMGFAVLGAILEEVTGRGYDEVIGALVYGPAGMATARPAGAADAARRYDLQHGRFVATDSLYPDRGSPAGGGFAAAVDLHRFVAALLDHQLLNERFTALLLSDFAGPAEAGGVPERFGFSGGAPGVSAALLSDRSEGRTVIVLANTTPFAADSFARRILELTR
jgi:D-alanyl-D-alanine carboxypeptidase